MIHHHPVYGDLELKVIPPTLSYAAQNASKAPTRDPLEDVWMWAGSWDEFLSRFRQESDVLVRAHKSAKERNDDRGLVNVEMRMKRLNDVLDGRLSIEDPEAYRAQLLAELEQKELRDMARRAQQAELREAANRVKAMGEELRQQELREMERRNRAMDVPTADIPARFEPVIKFAMRRFGLYPSQRPAIKLTDRSDTPWFKGVPRDADGCYLPDCHEIRVRTGLSDDRVEEVLLHEFAHAYDNLKGYAMSESFAYSQQAILYDEWRDERDSAEWAA